MFEDDNPIQKAECDLLKRSEYAKKIAHSILNMNAENGLCIGMFGPWGSGKSSILNMILEYINEKVTKQEDETIVLTFNPWNFTSEEQLFRQFFYTLANQFANRKEKIAKETGDAIKKYVNTAVDIALLVPDKRVAIGVKALNFFKSFFQNGNILDDRDLTKQKKNIEDRLRKQNKKIIIVIDDLDRLPNSSIQLIFQMVSSVAKFPNTIYMLAFDRNVVVNALSKVQNCDGNNYLEKVIQIPLEIPAIREEELQKILFAKLDHIIDTYKFELDVPHWQYVFKNCIEGNIKTLREINRLINTLQAKCIIAGNDLDFADLVGITLIENKFPDFYYWIKSNKDKLVGSTSLSNNSFKDNKIVIEANKREIQNLFPRDEVLFCGMLEVLFPYWARNQSADLNTMIRKQRIGHIDIFDRYFCLSLDKGEIPRVIINRILFDMGEVELTEFLKNDSVNYSCKCLIRELEAATCELVDNRRSVIAKTLIKNADLFDIDENISMFELTSYTQAMFLIENLLNGIKSSISVYSLLKDAIENADQDSIRMVSRLINLIEKQHGRLLDTNDSAYGQPSISLDQLLECEKSFLAKIKELSKSIDIFDLKESALILYLFENFDKDGFNEYLDEQLSSELETLKYLCTFASHWRSSDGGDAWSYGRDYKKYLSDDKIKSAYEKCLKDGSIWMLSEEQQLDVIAFELFTKPSKEWIGNVPKKYIVERQKELKHNK